MLSSITLSESNINGFEAWLLEIHLQVEFWAKMMVQHPRFKIRTKTKYLTQIILLDIYLAKVIFSTKRWITLSLKAFSLIQKQKILSERNENLEYG
jgi:hypothetical protein